MSELTSKRIRGSAIVDEDGGFVFTPYNTLGESQKKIKLIKATVHGALYRSKSGYSLRMKMGGNPVMPLHKLVAEIMELYAVAKNDEQP